MKFCPETGKECYATKGEARSAAKGMSTGRGRRKPSKTETYTCEYCEMLHLTHARKPLTKHRLR